MKDPTIPRTIVATTDIESSPGTRARAMKPAIAPMMIIMTMKVSTGSSWFGPPGGSASVSQLFPGGHRPDARLGSTGHTALGRGVAGRWRRGVGATAIGGG
jgi:hypothetical protein